MKNQMFMFVVFSLGLAAHMFMRVSRDVGFKIHSLIANNKGEGDSGGVTFTPEQQKAVDSLIDRRIGEVKSKYEPIVKEYEGLKQFKTEFEKSQEQKTLAEQEKAKEYDLAKKGYETKIGEFSTKLTAAQQENQNLRIEHSLTNEISKQGGFTEEVLAMIKGQASVDANGKIVMKSNDANGVETLVSVAEGIKKFLTDRPHLVQSKHNNGGGSGNGAGSGQGAGGTGSEGEDLATLNAKLAVAKRGTDLKLISELKTKITQAMAAKGINRNR